MVVDDKETLDKLSRCKEAGASFLKDAPLAIVDMGLGSCWIQVRERFGADGVPANEYVHNVLDIPLQLQVLSIIAVGHKGMERKPFDESHLQWEKVHINKYNGGE